MLTLIIQRDNFITETNVKITQKKDINHLKNVYRYKIGDKVRLIDGEYEYLSEIIELGNKEVNFKVLDKNEDIYSLSADIDIAIGILKNDKMNIVLQKLTEIGINKIIPLKTERVVVKLSDSKEKWNIIIEEALKQCKGVKIPKIDKIINMKNINFSEYDKIIFAYEKSIDGKNLYQQLTGDEKKILYFIGPEGGFTEDEIQFLKKQNGIEISLGKRIYRAETAAIVIGGILANVYK